MRAHQQQLGQADGGHREEQAGGVEEAPDDGQLHHHPEQDGGGQAHEQAHQVRHAGGDDEPDGQGDGHGTEIRLGEVQDPARPVDQGQAEGDEGGEHADDHAEHPGADADREGDQLEGDDREGRDVRTERAQRDGQLEVEVATTTHERQTTPLSGGAVMIGDRTTPVR